MYLYCNPFWPDEPPDMWTVPVSDRAVRSWSCKGQQTFNRRRVSVDWRRDNWCSPWVVFPLVSQRSPLKPLWLDLMSPVWILMGADSCASMLSVDVSMKIGPVTRRDAPPLSLTAPPTPSPCFEFAENQRVRIPSLAISGVRVHPPALVPPSRVTVPPCFLRLCVVPPWMWMGPPSPVYSAETLSPPSIKTPPPSRSSLALLPRPDEMPAFILMLPP